MTYVVDPAEDSVAANAVADHAYWLSGLRASVTPQRQRPARSTRARSLPGRVAPVAGIAESAGTLDGGERRPTPYQRREQTWGPAPAAAKADTLVVKATNIATAVIDAKRAGVSCAPKLELVSDGPLDLSIRCCAKPRRAKRCTKRETDALPARARAANRVGHGAPHGPARRGARTRA